MRFRVKRFKNHARVALSEKKVPLHPTSSIKLLDRAPNTINEKGDKPCIPEMQELLVCLKENDFDNNFCNSQIQKFNNCYTAHMAEAKVHKIQQLDGIITPETKQFSEKQITNLLRKYPNV